MRVKLQGTSPGVKDPEESGEISAHVILIEGEFFDGFRRGFEQGRISYLLVFADEAAQILRDGKGEQEMVTGELTLHLYFQPLLGLMGLTSGAMAIATGAVDPMGRAPFFALINGDSTGFGATSDDGIDDPAVCIRHKMGVALEVLGGKGPEDLIDCGHGRVPPSAD